MVTMRPAGALFWGVNGLNVASLGPRSDADEIKF